MKKIIMLVFPLTVATYLLAFESEIIPHRQKGDTLEIQPEKNHAQVQSLAVNLLDRYHYRKMPLNDSLSSVIFERYLRSLDPSRLYLMQSDIQKFEKYRHKFDDYLKKGNLEPAYEIFNTFRSAFFERNKRIYGLLEEGFDFTVNESFQVDREDASWPANQAEADEIWRKLVKDQALSLKLTKKEWTEIADILKKRYQNLEKTFSQIESDDVFEIYMNAFTESYDPHTAYFSPKTSDNFKISMSQSLEGIGARLQMDNDYVKVMEVIAGGPAFKSKLLNSGDRIVGVAQENEAGFVDVVGWRLDDVVQLIRGPKGSKVRLQIIPAEFGITGTPVEITLERDKVKLEDQLPIKEVITYKQGAKAYKIGVITIPSFYMNFEDSQKGIEDYNSASRDVRKLLTELEREKIDGLIIDLRLNGGGSLQEAIELTGLFIPEGPVVQVRNAEGGVEIANDPDPDQVYKGPLITLVNRFSASASEIFAGAIQDYGRGLIIGEQTFGKGTVQNLVDLSRFLMTDDEKFGQMKVTLAKFYRITGSSTQNRGVVPDIELPSAFGPDEFGESSQANSLPWDRIKATQYRGINMLTDEQIVDLNKSHAYRMKHDPDFKELTRSINEIKKERLRETVTLLEAKRLEERKKAEESQKTRLKLTGGSLETVESAEKKMRNAAEVEDAYLKESLNVMADMLKAYRGSQASVPRF